MLSIFIVTIANVNNNNYIYSYIYNCICKKLYIFNNWYRKYIYLISRNHVNNVSHLMMTMNEDKNEVPCHNYFTIQLSQINIFIVTDKYFFLSAFLIIILFIFHRYLIQFFSIIRPRENCLSDNQNC